MESWSKRKEKRRKLTGRKNGHEQRKEVIEKSGGEEREKREEK